MNEPFCKALYKPDPSKNLLFVLIMSFYQSLSREKIDFVSFIHWTQCDLQDAFDVIAPQFEEIEKLLPSTYTELSLQEVFELLLNKQIPCAFDKFVTFKAQLHLYDMWSHDHQFSIPDKYNPELRQIYVVREKAVDQACKDMYYVIKDISGYFRKFCMFCQKSFSRLHKCRKVSTCRACLRPFQTEKTFVTERQRFCDSKINEDLKIRCPSCNVTILSSSCHLQHKRFHNSMQF